MEHLPLVFCLQLREPGAGGGASSDSRETSRVPSTCRAPPRVGESYRGAPFIGFAVFIDRASRMAESGNEGEALRESVREMMSQCEAMHDEAKALAVGVQCILSK